MIDTHSHIYLEQFDKDRDETIERARNAGLSHILLPNVDSSTIEAMLETEKQYPDICQAMMGLHPTSVKENFSEELKKVEKWLHQRPFIAIGEIGMDLYWDSTFKKQQQEVLATQLKWAAEKEIPVVIHTREAFPEIFEVFEKNYDRRLSGVFHSFSGTIEDARLILQMPNFYLGINGVVTYKNSTLPQVLGEIGYDRLLLETDAPYLPPVPFRGKRNEPSYVAYTRDKLAGIFDVDTEILTAKTTQNAQKLFNLTIQ
ncbi:TatD family hydrolase [Geofilum rubicundum]|uniref:Putative deoxyribonuclease YcfH n=1 Tax=Geofilum rubicundum JCM 15548 TaxID=1236989 RepID=A0A0E9LTF0_9BACT|nr:TatD family hydrolase [Geofilum rubicundum]GAO28135.1 putative deoxyribonuclease YcfH [Geofilum rubicundum JCM 15548]